MPGPCSAPNGDHKLVNRRVAENDARINTGKTAVKKRGAIRQEVIDKEARMRKERRRQRDLEVADNT